MNDGATVEKENLEKIFERFYQTDKTKDGSGLGLAIAKAIYKQNNWQISCESKKTLPSSLSAFKFCLSLTRYHIYRNNKKGNDVYI